MYETSQVTPRLASFVSEFGQNNYFLSIKVVLGLKPRTTFWHAMETAWRLCIEHSNIYPYAILSQYQIRV